METAERLQWTSLAIGLLAFIAVMLQWSGLAPIILALGIAAAVIGAFAAHLAEKTNARTRVPARAGIWFGALGVIVGYLTLITG